jgi:hypothetical protein
MKAIQQQFSEIRVIHESLARGTIPIFEIELPNGDYITVNINVNDKGVIFDFDQQHDVFFDGEIERIGDGVYMLPYDDCFNHLDSYLEMIMSNINEGYLIPNDLFKGE